MSLYQDRQIKGFLLFLLLFALLFVGTGTVLTIYQVNDAEVLWLKHDEAVSSSLLEQGVSKEVIAVAFTNTEISKDGRSFPWAGSLPVADDFPICAGCQGQMAHSKKTNRILYFAGNGAGLMACPVSGLLNIQEVSLCERLSGVVICSMQT